MRESRGPALWVAYVPVAGWAVIALLPLYWVFVTAIQLDTLVDANPPRLLPAGIVEFFQTGDVEWLHRSFDVLLYVFKGTQMPRWLLNSTYIAVAVTAAVVVLDTMAGYALAKLRFPGRQAVFWALIGTMMIPGQVLLVPMFILLRRMDLINTHWALILPDLSLVIGVFLMRQYLLGLPSELLDAARIDGATEWQVFYRIVAPLARPAMATVAILTFVSVWNSFLWPLIALNKSTLYTLPVGLKTLQDQNLVQFKLLMSGATVAAIPTIAVFLFFQRYFIRGLTAGGLKG